MHLWTPRKQRPLSKNGKARKKAWIASVIENSKIGNSQWIKFPDSAKSRSGRVIPEQGTVASMQPCSLRDVPSRSSGSTLKQENHLPRKGVERVSGNGLNALGRVWDDLEGNGVTTSSALNSPGCPGNDKLSSVAEQRQVQVKSASEPHAC
jgi:hypothetical protein